MNRAEKRAVEALSNMRKAPGLSSVDVYRLPNHREVARFIRRHLHLYPDLYLSRRLYLRRRTHRFREAVREVIRRNRKHVEAWAKITHLLVIDHLRRQYDAEYQLGWRSGPNMSTTKAHAQVLEVYPTIARWQIV